MSNPDKLQRDFVQWLLDATRKKSPQAITRLAQHVMGLMFGGAHQLPMVKSQIQDTFEKVWTD